MGYAYVRADTHVCNGAGGGWWKEAKADVIGVVVVIVDVKIKENPDYQNNSAAHEHLIPIRPGTGP